MASDVSAGHGVGASAPAPPIERGMPILGCAVALFRDPVTFLLAAHRRHGSIFRVKALHHDYVVLAGAEANEFVHETGKQHFSARRFWGPFLREIEAPNSVVGLEGEDHAATRRMLAPQMAKGAAERHIADFMRIAGECFEAKSPGEAIAFVPFAQRLVSRQVGWILTGRIPSPAEHDAFLEYMRTVSVTLSLRRLPRWVLRLRGRRFRTVQLIFRNQNPAQISQATRPSEDGDFGIEDTRGCLTVPFNRCHIDEIKGSFNLVYHPLKGAGCLPDLIKLTGGTLDARALEVDLILRR